MTESPSKEELILLASSPDLLAQLSDSEKEDLCRYLEDLERTSPLWTPFPNSPQFMAFMSRADELYYGGAAGGGKSDLLLGLAITAHQQSIIFRREYTQMKGGGGLIERSKRIICKPEFGVYNNNDAMWRLDDGRTLEFGAVKDVDDWTKYQGRPYDFLGFDELPHFDIIQYRSLTAWNRTVIRGQRCRIVGAGNPPVSAEQRWVINEWAPWLDDTFDNPAEPGELRWYVVDPNDDKTIWLESPDPVEFTDKRTGRLRTINPTSRTFIPASVEDNPILAATNYGDKLDSLPEPLRSILRGDFQAGMEDDAYQVIPTEWIRIAMKLWRERGYGSLPVQCLGCDPVWGGKDDWGGCKRRGLWFSEVTVHPGKEVTSGAVGATKAWELIKGEPNPHQIQVNVDVIGYGSATYEACCRMKMNAVPINVSDPCEETDRTECLLFANLRAYGYWGLRELLDPDNGFAVQLPNDNKLLQELAAHRFRIRPGNVIQIEDKDDIKKRIGRSPDRAEAVMLSSLSKPPERGARTYNVG